MPAIIIILMLLITVIAARRRRQRRQKQAPKEWIQVGTLPTVGELCRSGAGAISI